MQEQVNEKSVSLTINTTKLTGRVLAKALLKLLDEMKKPQKNKTPQTYHGKQSVKSLVTQGAGVSNIEINDGNIKSFDRVARKYGVDYALKKDVSGDKWLVFFKGRDTDALTAAFKEYSAKMLSKSKKPSIITALDKMKELVKNQTVDKVKNKQKGEHEL